jgi:hypothetical protein
MWNLLWREEMVFYYENQPVAECMRFKGPPQGSVLSPFSYSFYTFQTDWVLPVRCSMLQYVDAMAVYESHDDVENVQRTVQSACTGLNEFFREKVWANPSVCVTLNGQCISVDPENRYLGVEFDKKILWDAHLRYILPKCYKLINFLRSIAGVSCEAHSGVMLGWFFFVWKKKKIGIIKTIVGFYMHFLI